MFLRLLIALLVTLSLGSNALFAQQDEAENTGLIVLEMAGELGSEYSKLIGIVKTDWKSKGRTISVPAHVSYRLADGLVRIEHSTPIKKDGKTTGLVTLSTTIDSDALQIVDVPKGTQTFSAPRRKNEPAKKRTLTKTATKHHKLALSDLKGVELRSWKLTSSISD